jgi:uncharacterized membrane protein
MKFSKKKLLFVYILIFMGLAVASYLTFLHYTGHSALCGVSNVFSNCDMVLQSKYAEVFGVPVALFGVVFYLFLFIVFSEIAKRRQKFFIEIMFALEIFGFIFSILLTYTQIFIIGAVCPYCLTSAIVTTALFFISFYMQHKNSK